MCVFYVYNPLKKYKSKDDFTPNMDICFVVSAKPD